MNNRSALTKTKEEKTWQACSCSIFEHVRGKCKIFGILGKYLKQDARNFVLNLAESWARM